MTRRLLLVYEAAAGAGATSALGFCSLGSPCCESCLSTEPTARPPLVPTYLRSFLQEGDDHRGVAAPHRPVEGPHPAVVDVLDHGPMVHQKLNLQQQRRQSVLLRGGPQCAAGVKSEQPKLALLHCLCRNHLCGAELSSLSRTAPVEARAEGKHDACCCIELRCTIL